MNLSTIALVLLAWQLLSNNNQSKPRSSATPLDTISQFVNDDAKSIIDCVGKLSSNDATQMDKTGAILQMMSNPAVMSMASSLFGNGKTSDSAKADEPIVNDEGYEFEQPSKDSKEFFKPIDNIADAEIKSKLYWFYDNWYVK